MSKQRVPPVQETDLDRILKLIPTEVLAFYTAAVPATANIQWTLFPLFLFLAGLALVPLVLFLDGRAVNVPARWPQYVVRSLAFAAWAPAISWPLVPWCTDVGWLTSLAVLLVPLLGGLVLRDRMRASPRR